MASRVLGLYRRLESRPFGRWLFATLVCWKAPYFTGIAPRIVELGPGRGVATIAHRRRVTNHLGTVHAIALCNLAEFIGGLTTDASLPDGMRWIPRAMQVEYLKKAVGTMRAVATPDFAPHVAEAGYELPVAVEITDPSGTPVLRARIAMWISPVTPRA
ncbi:hotdog fold domain-containing protein [Luteimonas kalidii]|uniref:Hotdog fold domain-containing protein n=1 Tax=Luteimonas kalidii TaxID=3042025 RepID=A0ABT6JW04_9GAMM|nr:hotdog fold domain-containing protein [Luteimonas kalidii]MDH5834660.1 hotdog fold domain-containing protein [Luteimonas kalidii]